MAKNPYSDHAKNLAEYAYIKGSLDNITVIIYLIEHSKEKTSKIATKIEKYLYMG